MYEASSTEVSLDLEPTLSQVLRTSDSENVKSLPTSPSIIAPISLTLS